MASTIVILAYFILYRSYTLVKRCFRNIFFQRKWNIEFYGGVPNKILCLHKIIFLRFAFRNYHLINGKKDKYNSCATSIMIQCYLLLAILYCIYVLLASFSTLFIFYGIYCGSDTLCFTVNTYSSIVWWHQNFFIT